MADLVCFLVEERNRRPNPHLEQDIDERGGGPVELVDIVRVDTDEVLAEGVVWPWADPVPVGAMWLTDNDLSSHFPHPGPNLYVLLPGRHVWHVDGRASNCSRPDDNEHHCWVRHGDPPAVTVDKDGDTCEAGAGSIRTDDYHGFLRDGVLVEA